MLAVLLNHDFLAASALPDRTGRTPLTLAALRNDREIVEALLANAAAVDGKDGAAAATP